MKKLFPLLLTVALVVPTSLPGLILSRGVEALGSGREFPSAPPLPTGLYRTRVTLRQPAGWTRLEKLGVTVLERGDDWALVLADEEQLEALARLRFEPRSTDELGSLLQTQGSDGAWLRASLQPLDGACCRHAG